MNALDNPLYALVRFLASLLVLFALAWLDLGHDENVPTIVYLLVGALNGVDLYNLVKTKGKSDA